VKLTVEDIVAAPMFTVWKDMRGKTACQDRSTEWWDLFGGATISDEVEDKAIELLGDDFADIPLLNVQGDDDLRMEHGVELEFDDLDAGLLALEHGLTLVKLPDEMEGERAKYWRLYAVGPLPDPWKRCIEHDRKLEEERAREDVCVLR
jgi:hypothetical protein